MRLNYFKLGDIAKEDEINALITIFLYNQESIKDVIIMDNDGYKTKFANYITEFHNQLSEDSSESYLNTNIDYTNENIIIKEASGYIKIICESNLKCSYIIEFNGRKYKSGSGIISIPLQDFEDELNNSAGFIILDNKFNVEIEYETPFIKDIKGDDHTINTTEELNNIIETAEDNEIITLNVSNDILHNINRPIAIDKKTVIINNASFIYKRNINNRIFNVSTDGKLELNNASFENFTKCNTDGGLIFNSGECIINDSIFNNCMTTGNGIIKSLGNLTIENTEFISCRAKNGGAIFTDKDEVL